MKKRKYNGIKLVLILVLIGSFTVGCNVNDNMTGKDDEKEISTDIGDASYDILERSENISDLVVDLYGVDNATSIIFNDVVVIGIEMAEDRKFTDDVREGIINTVLENETIVRQVLISNSEKTFEEIESIISCLMNGEPYDDQVQDINRIIDQLKKE